MDILDQYIKSAPSAQNALDIFKGEWSSKLPGALAELQAGNSLLFEDGRISWAIPKLGGAQGKTVLELGPLEAGHTYMLEQFGAEQIIAIEANSRAFLKCLVIKELLDLKRSRFLYGDFIDYLRANQKTFDVCIASGVLYHMQNPAELISLIAKASSRTFLWTHYYDSSIISNNSNLQHKLAQGTPANYSGFKHTLYRQEYGAALGWGGFCGAGSEFSHWMSREDIVSCLKYFGFKDVEMGFDQPDHPNGPSFALTAVK